MEKAQPRRSRLKKIQWIPVVAGFLKKDGRILVGQRPEHHSLAGLWEFPGGKIEEGESDENALCREFEEELCLRIENVRHFKTVRHEYPDRSLELRFYIADVDSFVTPEKLNAHSEVKWFTLDEASACPLLPANVTIVEELRVLLV